MTTARLSSELSRPGYNDFGPDENLSPMFPPRVTPTRAAWDLERQRLRQRWDEILGTPSFGPFDRTAAAIETFDLPEGQATVLRLPTGPETRQLAVLVRPRHAPHSPCPAAIVPFYHPDDSIGYNLATRERLTEGTTIQFGRHLALQGYVTLCTEAFPYNTVPEPANNTGFAWWQAAAAKVLAENPHWTGMAKLVWDTRLATDFLLEQSGIDRDRVAIIGHSLGGKMAFYASCLDERIAACIASDFGIGFGFTNWSDPWYLGDKLKDANLGVAHHHLLALHAPRSFLLIAGQYDKPASWQYINAAKPVYELHGKQDALGAIDHATGHRPPNEAMLTAYRWLAEQFNYQTDGIGEEPQTQCGLSTGRPEGPSLRPACCS